MEQFFIVDDGRARTLLPYLKCLGRVGPLRPRSAAGSLMECDDFKIQQFLIW